MLNIYMYIVREINIVRVLVHAYLLQHKSWRVGDLDPGGSTFPVPFYSGRGFSSRIARQPYRVPDRLPLRSPRHLGGLREGGHGNVGELALSEIGEVGRI